jgi:pimeloyl-ACP methyl ester carboxylesterase
MSRDAISWRGHRVHVTATGKGRPLLLVSGVGANSEMWVPFTKGFPNRRIITFDAPGTGRSTTPLYPVPIAALAELATATLDHFEVGAADVVGYSYGGLVAQQLAYDAPTRVRRLVLVATHCGVGCVLGSPNAIAGISTTLRFYSPMYFERTAPMCFGGATARSASVRREMFAARRQQPPSAYGYFLQLLGTMGWSSKPFLHQISHETLVVSGDDDPLVPPANAELLAAGIPNATLEIVERGGHLLLLDDATNTCARIGRFVDAESER